MDFEEFLKKYAQLVNKETEKVLGSAVEDGKQIHPRLGKLMDEFLECSRGGKNLRGVLVLLGFQIAGGKNFESIIPAGVAFEIFQTAILAQDDVIDKSEIRRSRASLYKSLGGDHRAVSETLCLSDIGIFLSFRTLSSLKVGEAIKNRAINFFSQTLTQTVWGELLDIELPYLGKEFKDQDVLKISLLKTARYTISGPLILGALLAGADITLVKKLQNFGDNLGIGFQIQDDILGVFGNEKEMGKPADSDIKEGKATLLAAFALKNSEANDLDLLKKYYGDESISMAQVEMIKGIFEKSGALEYAKAQAQRYFKQARSALKEGQEGLLYSLVDFIAT